VIYQAQSLAQLRVLDGQRAPAFVTLHLAGCADDGAGRCPLKAVIPSLEKAAALAR
jgi:hypothetical protein